MNKHEAMKILGITNPSFTKEELVKVYRKAVRENHPDFPGNEGKTRKMQDINLAYEILTEILEKETKARETLSLQEYKNKTIAEIRNRVFDGLKFDQTKGCYTIPKNYQEFYGHNAFGSNNLISMLEKGFLEISSKITSAKAKEEVDIIANTYFDCVKESFTKFTDIIFDSVVKSLKEEKLPCNDKLIADVKNELYRVTSLGRLFVKVKSSIDKILEVAQKDKKEAQIRREENKKFLEYKDEKLKEYIKLVELLPHTSDDYKEASQLYQKLYRNTSRRQFDFDYQKAMEFVRKCIKDEIAEDVERTRKELNAKYMAATSSCSVEENIKLAKILEYALYFLNIVYKKEDLAIFSELTFSDVESDLKQLSLLLDIPKDGFYIQRNFSYMNTKVTYVKSHNLKLYTKEIYLDSDEITKTEEVSDIQKFKETYISLDEFFEKATSLGIITERGKAFMVYDGIALCRIEKDFLGEPYYAFVPEKHIKPSGKTFYYKMNGLYTIFMQKVYPVINGMSAEIEALESDPINPNKGSTFRKK